MKSIDHAAEFAQIERMLGEVQQRIRAIGDKRPRTRLPDGLRQLIQWRRLRERHFGPGLFADPAWDILIELAASHVERRSVPVSSLCAAAAVPSTTALRWINILVDRGLVVRESDPRDKRRVYVRLSQTGLQKMEAYLESVGIVEPKSGQTRSATPVPTPGPAHAPSPGTR